MPALAVRDTERLLRIVAEAESIGGDQPFTPDLLGELGRLVFADGVGYSEIDRARRRDLLHVGWPDDEDDDVEFEDEVVWRVVLEEHPLCLQQGKGHFGAMKLSDFLTQRELHRTWVYDNWFRPSASSTSSRSRFPHRGGTRRRFFSVGVAAGTSQSATGSSSTVCSRTSPASGKRHGHVDCSSRHSQASIKRPSVTHAE
jgi:hypothetical protein